LKTDTSPIPILRRIPWWVNVFLAFLFYCGLKYIFPQLHTSNEFLNNIKPLAPKAAPIVAMVFLLFGAVRLYETDKHEDKDNSDQH
jgi:hypothetical protein